MTSVPSSRKTARPAKAKSPAPKPSSKITSPNFSRGRPVSNSSASSPHRTRLREDRAAFLHARLAQATHLSPQDREQIESIMEEAFEKFLVQPAERLRDERELRRKIQNVEALRDLFLSDRDKR